MNENIFTEELSKEITTLRDDAILNCIKKHYSLNVHCGFTLLRLACKARIVGENIFDKEFISNYATDINNNYMDKLLEIINLEIATAEAKFFIENAQEINSLPKVHKNNKKVLSSFIHEGIRSGFKLKCKIVAKLMEVAV